TPIQDVPQAVSVISQQQIEDQAMRSIADVLRYVPGALPAQGEGHRDQIILRGNNSTADFFVDGLRDDVQYYRGLYNVERVEILKGPNAMIFGRGGGGGIINRVIKRSSLSEMREVAISADSYGGYRLTADLDQPLASGAGLRINGMYEKGESFRRHVDLERYGINPTVGFLVGGGTRVDLGVEHFQDRRTTDRGIPSLDGEPLEGFDRTFFGDPELSFAKAKVNVANLAVQHELGDGLTLRNRTLLGDYDKFYQNVYLNSAVLAPDGSNPGAGVRLGAYNSSNDRTNIFNQTDLIWNTQLGGVDQTIVFGFEIGRQKSRNERISGTIVGGNRVPLSDPTVDVDVIFSPSPSDANNRTRATVAAFYVQDQICFSPMFELLAGIRFDSFKLNVDDFRGAGAEFTRTDELISPRLGLLFKPQTNLSFYASYARSYLPQSGDQFSGLDLNSEALKPEQFDNYEIGAKWEPVEGLLATAAIYQLDRSNTRAADPLDPTRVVLTGAQRSRGLELGLERSISHRWQIAAGYALQKAEITETTAAAPEGREVPLVPRHSFSLWNRYDVNDRLGLGLGIIARSKSYASISNQVRLPAFARIDAAAFYELTRGVELQLNVENLFGADYYPTAHNDNNIGPGGPRSAKATLRFGF
ncbi:MAG: TonB-dependent siderophore receptor, partial [Sphingomonas sp.]|nr:TonB-dependent siderophore receptor [Sphingomonas sp.]